MSTEASSTAKRCSRSPEIAAHDPLKSLPDELALRARKSRIVLDDQVDQVLAVRLIFQIEGFLDFLFPEPLILEQFQEFWRTASFPRSRAALDWQALNHLGIGSMSVVGGNPEGLCSV